MNRLLTWLCLCLLAALLVEPLCAQQSVPPGYRAYTLRHEQATVAATKLRTILNDNTSRSDVLVDRRLNRILLRGDDSQHQIAAALVKTIDQPTQAQRAKSPEQKNLVKGYRVPIDMLEEVTAKVKARFPLSTGTRIAPDTRLGQILIVAPPKTHHEIETLINQSLQIGGRDDAATASFNPPNNARPNNRPGANSTHQANANALTLPRGTNDHQLRNIDWKQFEDTVRRRFGNSVAFDTQRNGEVSSLVMAGQEGESPVLQVDRTTNRVHFNRNNELAAAWLQVAQALDTSNAKGPSAANVVPINRANPNTIQRTIGMLMSTPLNQGAVTTSALTLNDRKWGGDIISNIFAQDGKEGGDAQPKENQPKDDPNKEGGEEEETGLIGPVQIEFIPGLGVFIIRGNKRDVAKVMEIIQQIEKLTEETEPEIVIHTLKHVNGTSVATLVTELYEQVFGQRQSTVSITALDQPNAIMLIGQEKAVTAVQRLINKLDQPLSPETSLRVFPLKFAPAVDVERQIRNFYVNRPGQDQEPRGGLGGNPRVLADYRTNSLIVNASPRDMLEVEHFIKELDKDEATATAEVRVFKLKNTLAEDLAQVLQDAITGVAPDQQQGGAAGGQAGSPTSVSISSKKLSLVAIDENGNKLIESGLLAGATFTPEASGNSIIVRAQSKSMSLIAELINQLDRLPDAEAQIKVFAIENGDATSLAQMLQQLFGQQVTAGQTAFGQAFNQAITQQTTGGESSLVPLRVTVDARTNSIIVSGGSSDLEVVEVLLLRLDENDLSEFRVQVFRLQNAFSDDVGTAINNYLIQQQQLLQQTTQILNQAGSFEQIDRQVIVVSEPITNSLIVSAKRRYFEEIVQVIEDLDFRPPMVMVQVVIAEVELDDLFEFGVEFGLQDSLLFDRGAASIGFPFKDAAALGNDLNATSQSTRDSLAGQAVSAFSLGRASQQVGYGGLVLSAANESVNILLRALQDTGRLQVLSRPQIMTLDNQEAFVQVGAQVPRITNSTINQFGGIQNTTQDEDVGLILNVTPRILPDGYVWLSVAAERSEVGDIQDGIPIGTDQNGNAILSPQINTTTADTVIRAKSGQTVVFAGLIQKGRIVSRRGIPILSDMPLVGPLFRFDREVETRSELLIIMTPHVIQHESDLDWLNMVESERMSWCLSDLIDIHGEVNLSGGHGLWGAGSSPIIYPHTDPTGSAHRVIEEVTPSPSDTPMPGSTTVVEPMMPQIELRQPTAPPALNDAANQAPQGRGYPQQRGIQLAPAGHDPGQIVPPVQTSHYQRGFQQQFRVPQPVHLPQVQNQTRVSYGPKPTNQRLAWRNQYNSARVNVPRLPQQPNLQQGQPVVGQQVQNGAVPYGTQPPSYQTQPYQQPQPEAYRTGSLPVQRRW